MFHVTSIDGAKEVVWLLYIHMCTLCLYGSCCKL